jgi:hypothetical protein
VFDVLAADERALIGEPIERRRSQLGRVADPEGSIVLSRPFEGGAALYAEAIARGYGGDRGQACGLAVSARPAQPRLDQDQERGGDGGCSGAI